jgi:hypothetical protein
MRDTAVFVRAEPPILCAQLNIGAAHQESYKLLRHDKGFQLKFALD